MKDSDLGEEKKPTPKILEPEYKDTETNEDLFETLK